MEEKLYCPTCGKEIKMVGGVCDVSSYYDLEGNWLEDFDRSCINYCYCVECGEELPKEITNRVF